MQKGDMKDYCATLLKERIFKKSLQMYNWQNGEMGEIKGSIPLRIAWPELNN